jgi:hypothetical protein
MKIIITLVLFCLSIKGFSATADRLKEVKNKILVVEIPKLKEGEGNEIAYVFFRQKLTNAFTKLWTYNDSITFVETDSLRAFVMRSPKSYAVIKYGEKIDAMSDKYSINYLTKTDSCPHLTLFLPGEGPEVLFYQMPKGRADFAIAIHQINSAIQVFLTHPRITQNFVNFYLKSKEEQPRFDTKYLTLLINREHFGGELNEKKLAKAYPYKLRVVDGAEWETALLDKNKDVACYVGHMMIFVVNTRRDFNQNGSFGDDLPVEKTMLLFMNSVVVASDGHSELLSKKKDLKGALADFKKQLDKNEKIAQKAQKD